MNVRVEGELRDKAENGDIVGDVVAVVLGMLHEHAQTSRLLGPLRDLDVVGAGDGRDSGGFIVAMRCTDTMSARDERGSTEVAVASLQGENVWLGVLGGDVTANDESFSRDKGND